MVYGQPEVGHNEVDFLMKQLIWMQKEGNNDIYFSTCINPAIYINPVKSSIMVTWSSPISTLVPLFC